MELIKNYFGGVTQKTLAICGLCMILSRPFFDTSLSPKLFYSILAIIILTIVGGIARPRQLGMALCDFFVSLIGFTIFSTKHLSISTAFLIFISSPMLLSRFFSLWLFTGAYGHCTGFLQK